jgi:hypothetical protein
MCCGRGEEAAEGIAHQEKIGAVSKLVIETFAVLSLVRGTKFVAAPLTR